MKLLRVKKFSVGKIPNSMFHIIYETIEKGIKNTKPNGNGPIASQISFIRANFQTQSNDIIITGELIFQLNITAKTTLEEIKSNFKKEVHRLGFYKVNLQKTVYR